MRPEKESIINEYSEGLKEINYVFLADYRGLSVEKFAELRSQLRSSGSTMQVVKNCLFQKAIEGSDWDNLNELLDGPTAIIRGDGDVTVVAKQLKAYAKANEGPAIKGGNVDGTLLSDADVTALSEIPAREVLLGQLVGTIAAPLSQTVGVLSQKVASLVYVLKAIEEKKK